MEENKNVSISINLGDGSITISGSETFVEKNMNSVFDFVERNRQFVPQTTASEEDATKGDKFSTQSTLTTPPIENPKIGDKYIKAGVYHIGAEDGAISILKTVPGKNKAEKAKNIALIVLYIRKGKVDGKELIPICEKHACYDSGNFSSTFKNEKTNIIRKGSGQSWTLELTQPGESAALALLEEMANDKK